MGLPVVELVVYIITCTVIDTIIDTIIYPLELVNDGKIADDISENQGSRLNVIDSARYSLSTRSPVVIYLSEIHWSVDETQLCSSVE